MVETRTLYSDTHGVELTGCHDECHAMTLRSKTDIVTEVFTVLVSTLLPSGSAGFYCFTPSQLVKSIPTKEKNVQGPSSEI